MAEITANPLAPDSAQPANIWDEGSLSCLNITEGLERTCDASAPPSTYPWYTDEERYTPQVQADGGVLSEWKPKYSPSPEQAERDRLAAYEAGVPHGYQPLRDQYAGLPTVSLRVVSDLHEDGEYERVDAAGRHSGGPFRVDVALKMRVHDLRRIIMEKSSIPCGLQRLSYAGKHMEDSQRTLEHYGVAYWHKRFPDWPLKIRCLFSYLVEAADKRANAGNTPGAAASVVNLPHTAKPARDDGGGGGSSGCAGHSASAPASQSAATGGIPSGPPGAVPAAAPSNLDLGARSKPAQRRFLNCTIS